MPESDKRKPISIYLTPRAAKILQEYNKGSGYGSISRTVEEIVLAYNDIFENYIAFWSQIRGKSSEPIPRSLYWYLVSSTTNTMRRAQKEKIK